MHLRYRFWSTGKLKAEGRGGAHVGARISSGCIVKMMAGWDVWNNGRIFCGVKVEGMWLDQVWGREEGRCGTGPHWITKARCMVLSGVFSPH